MAFAHTAPDDWRLNWEADWRDWMEEWDVDNLFDEWGNLLAFLNDLWDAMDANQRPPNPGGLSREDLLQWYFYFNPPTFAELTQRFQTSFTTVALPDIIAYVETLPDSPASLLDIERFISFYDFHNNLVDNNFEIKLMVSHMRVAIVDSNQGLLYDHDVDFIINPKPFRADGTTTNPGVPGGPTGSAANNGLIQVPIKDAAGNPTGNFFWINIDFEIPPPQ